MKIKIKEIFTPRRVLLALLTGIVISWLIKDMITPLLFDGKSFDGRSLSIQIALMIPYIFFAFAVFLLVFYFLDLLFARQVNLLIKRMNPTNKLVNVLESASLYSRVPISDSQYKETFIIVAVFFGLVLAFSILLVFAWFSPLNYHVFIGDDLYWIKLYQTTMPSVGFWHNAFTIGNEVGKFRPIPTTLILMTTGVCQENFDCFVGIDFFMIVANAFLASIIAYKLTSRWIPSIFISSTLIILSRFSYYAALQVLGIMENLAMTFVLLLVLCFIYFMRSANIKWMALIIILFLLLLLTHERFIVMVVPVAFSLFTKKKDLKKAQFLFSLLVLILATSSYFLLREYIFNARFLTGAGSSSIIDTFSIYQVMSFIGQGVLNLIGFNAGPDYLSGKYFLNAGPGGILVGVFLSVALVILFYMLVKQHLNKRSAIDLGIVMVLILMIGGMILACSITFRQEYRWLYTPFAVFVLLVCYFLSMIENLKVKYVMALMLMISFASVDIFYKPYMNNLYFIQKSQTASSIKREIIDKSSYADLAQKEIFLLIENDVMKNWVLGGGYFFELYAPKIKVQYVNDLSEIPTSSLDNNHLLVFSVTETKVKDITQEALQDRINESRYVEEYDFVASFSSGVWNDIYLAGAPYGHGVFPMSWQDNFGLPNSTITIISPYDILFPSITCIDGSELIFSAGIPYTSSDGADLSVDQVKAGKQKQLLLVSLNPAEQEGIVTWSDYKVAIVDCAEEPIDIKFGVSSPSGNPVADWVALRNVKLVIENK